jgi:hypothetical protein
MNKQENVYGGMPPDKSVYTPLPLDGSTAHSTSTVNEKRTSNQRVLTKSVV